ncbi:MAG TPA: DUF3987 domain-containing protein [Rectinema sp.]|nr:DUF3987 domain-containing protein [Rectinema sp.]
MANLEPFFKLLLGRNNGYLCIATLDQVTRNFQEKFFNYPKALNEITDYLDKVIPDTNVYFCPNLFSAPRRIKANVISAPNAWSDLDRCNPDVLLVRPSVVLESSPGRYQAFWIFDDEVDPENAEDISRRIARFHREDGADQSGWDLTQLLRVPNSTNFKYDNEPEVRIVRADKSFYRLEDFEEYPVADFIAVTEDTQLSPMMQSMTGEDVLSLRSELVTPALERYFKDSPEDDADWSQALWFLECAAFESGFTKDEVFILARDSACNKYARDSRPESDLWKDVLRAEEHYNIQAKGQDHDKAKPVVQQIMSDYEIEYVKQLEPTFVENYVKWASSLTDAAKQYHQAGAFVILSALISGSVTLPTSYDKIIPNLWFMILADTTLTRKSTAMDIAMDLLEEANADAVMATDGSIEGMLATLAVRPKKPSVFLRDEFSGLIEAILKKDYLAGMAEMFTKLYDGKLMKRILKREVVEVRDPRLIIFAGGIKNKVTSLLSYEHVSSGFIPRFVFITAESDLSRVRPLGPPSTVSEGGRNRILEQIRAIKEHYNKVALLTVGGQETALEVSSDFQAYLTEEAWQRYTRLEYDLLKFGTKSWNAMLMTPVFDRLSKSILKAAILIAASRQVDNEATVTVTLDDLLRAMSYGEGWKTFAEEVIMSVGNTADERLVKEIYDFISSYDQMGGANRSLICRTFKLPAKRATEIFSTLEAHGLIMKVPGTSGQTVKYSTL